MPSRRGRRVRLFLIAISLLGIFATDTVVVTQVAIAVLYVVPVVLASHLRRTRAVALTASVATALITAGAFTEAAVASVGTQDFSIGRSAATRSIAALVVWITAALAARRAHGSDRWGAAESWMRAAGAAVDDALIATDPRGRVFVWNDAASELFGASDSDALRRRLEDLLGESASPRTATGERPRSEADDEQVRPVAMGFPDRAGERFLALHRARAYSAGGDLLGEVLVARPADGPSPPEDRASSGKKALEVAVASAEEARENDRRKSEFMAVLAHELRNPLTAITYGVYSLRTAVQNPARIEGISNQLEHQAKKMKQILEDLFDLERLARGKLRVEPRRVELGDVVRGAVDSVEESARHRGVRMTLSIDEGVRVHGDSVRLDQIFTNLLTNAIKFTDADGQVWVEVLEEENEAVVRVRDNGEGMSPEFLPRAFEPFRQERIDAPSGERREGLGLGLGLGLVKGLTQLHGGRVSVASDGRGCGCEFTVRLPLAGRRAHGDTPTRHPGADSERSRELLLVEDSRDLAHEFSRALERYGYSVHIHHDAESALETFDEARPQAVLIDINLPGMNGYELAQELRRRAGGDLVLIAVTALGEEHDFERSREAGFEQHFVKPVDVAGLHKYLTRV